jgi:hypothetical protein
MSDLIKLGNFVCDLQERQRMYVMDWGCESPNLKELIDRTKEIITEKFMGRDPDAKFTVMGDLPKLRKER